MPLLTGLTHAAKAIHRLARQRQIHMNNINRFDNEETTFEQYLFEMARRTQSIKYFIDISESLTLPHSSSNIYPTT